jgi:hypothetical protein
VPWPAIHAAVDLEVPGYLGMSLLYKKANRIRPLLIRHQLTGLVWRPLVEAARWRHVRFYKRLAAADATVTDGGRRWLGALSPPAPVPLVPTGLV